MSGFSWDIFQLREPWWLLLALQPVLISLFAGLRYRRHNRAYADPDLLPWVVAGSARHENTHTAIRFLLMQLCWLFIALAMAGPRYPDPVRTPDRANAADIMVVVDVSRSMTATDIRPDRLKRAKAELFQLLLQNQVDRIGIILFAGHAHVLSPLTWDRHVSRFYVDSIQAGLLPTEGTDINAAIALANQELKNSSNPVILVMSDGDFNQADTTTLETGLPLHILGIGTEGGVPLADEEGGWLTYENRPVLTRLQQQTLEDIASASGGQYVAVTEEAGLLDKLYQRTSNSKASRKTVKAQDQAWVELYAWFLVPALILLLLLSVQFPWKRGLQDKAALMMLFLVISIIPLEDLKAQELPVNKEAQAYQAYTKKDFRAALDIYSVYTGYRARMGEGSSAYQMKDYKRAITQFTQAFLVAGADSQRSNALYNLANSFFYIEDYLSAKQVYEDTLKYQPHPQAKANLAFVVSLLASIKDDPFSGESRAKRGGRGPRSQLADENTQGGGDFSLDDKEKEIVSSGQHTTRTESDLSGIIASGKGQVQVADESIQEQDTSVLGVVSVSELLEARKRVLQAKQNQAQLWKSLFEEAQGFPAPLEKPLTQPGVLPW